MKRLYARHRLDIKLRHLAYAISTMSASGDWKAATDVERIWSAQGAALACYSVRSGFPLLPSALALPRGSGVLFPVVPHTRLPRLAKHHGLLAVPVRPDPATLPRHPTLRA